MNRAELCASAKKEKGLSFSGYSSVLASTPPWCAVACRGEKKKKKINAWNAGRPKNVSDKGCFLVARLSLNTPEALCTQE